MFKPEKKPTAWLFVRVIDNFGDVGVAWRLAQNMRAFFAARVHLWVDDIAALRALVPSAAAGMVCQGVHIHAWADEAALAQTLAALPPPQWLIETFGCNLPAPVLARIAADKPLWLNWEYLSAEDWAADLHAMPSLQSNGAAKYFWFMGFSPASGGLLREADYPQQRHAFLADTTAQAAFRQRYGLPESPAGGQSGLLFAYASPYWPQWLAVWQAAGVPMNLWLAGGQVADSLRAAGVIGAADLQAPGDVWQSGSVRLQRIPFVPQAEFDRLLWLADWAVVRGEDSFVRAQWAQLPFIWHIYPQAEAAHLPKLQAFWQQATAAWPSALRQAHTALSGELNGAGGLSDAARQAAWQTLQTPGLWPQAATAWAQTLQQQPSAMEKLAIFSQDTLK